MKVKFIFIHELPPSRELDELRFSKCNETKHSSITLLFLIWNLSVNKTNQDDPCVQIISNLPIHFAHLGWPKRLELNLVSTAWRNWAYCHSTPLDRMPVHCRATPMIFLLVPSYTPKQSATLYHWSEASCLRKWHNNFIFIFLFYSFDDLMDKSTSDH